MNKHTITGLILAGGRGTRMGHVDKGLQPFRGKTMAAHVLERLSPQVGTMMINANQNLDAYAAMGVPVWPDAVEGFAGPLAGLHAGLLHCNTPLLVTAPCDSPFLPTDLVARLAEARERRDADLAVAVTPGGRDGKSQAHPVFCLVKRSVLPHLGDFLASGGRKIDAWYSALDVVDVLFEDEDAFRNINTREELRQQDQT